MKNNFPFRTHWKKPEEPKAAPETSQYLPRAVDYFNRTAEALGPYPLADTAMLIVLYTHIAASLSYQDPAAAQMAEQIEKVVKLPPVDFYAASKK